MKKNEVSIVFTGDIGFDRYMSKKWEDDDLLSSGILDFCHSADHVCINVEGALFSDDGSKARGEFFHSMNPAAVSVFKKMEADIWCIANNHIMDAGSEGIISTLDIAKESGAVTFGAGLNEYEASNPVYIDGAGGIGIIGVGYFDDCVPATETSPGVFRWNAMEKIAERISEIKKKNRFCVVVAHGGEEFAAMPLSYTRDRYIKYLEMGADVVVGHHPHVPENYELFDNGKAIFYSLGNFIFDTDYQRAHLYTDIGILLKLIFTDKGISFEAIGTKIDRNTERIDIGDLPDIFENIDAEEYSRLESLAAKAYVKEDMRTMIYLKPQIYKNATSEVWNAYFDKGSEGCVKGEHLDYELILPVVEKFDEEKWKESRLDKVKEYIWKLL